MTENSSLNFISITGMLLVIFFLPGILGCSYAEYDEFIIGKWQVVKWESDKRAEAGDVDKYWFEFKEDGSYASWFGGMNQKGSYRLENNKLYTKAEGEEEIVVEIRSLSPDTMRIGMNRGGVPETLLLAHE